VAVDEMPDPIAGLFGAPIPFGEHIRFYLDENIDQRIVEPLRAHGANITTVEEQTMKGERDDVLILARATELGCVLVTSDSDFFVINGRINELWLTEETSHAGIIFVSSPRSPGKLVGELVKIRHDRPPEQMANLIWII
jgi:hypothetical protein